MEQVLSDVTLSVNRIRSELVGGIEEKREAVTGRGQSIITQFESKLTQLQERRGRLEEQAISDDHIGFLQVQRCSFITNTSDSLCVFNLLLLFFVTTSKASNTELWSNALHVTIKTLCYIHKLTPLQMLVL